MLNPGKTTKRLFDETGGNDRCADKPDVAPRCVGTSILRFLTCVMFACLPPVLNRLK